MSPTSETVPPMPGRASGARASTVNAANSSGATAGSASDPLGGINAKVRKRQQLILAGIGSVILVAGGSYIVSKSKSDAPIKATDPVDVEISVDGMTGKKMAQSEWIAKSENQIAEAESRVKALEAKMPAVDQVSNDLAALKQENAKLKADGSRLFEIYEKQNAVQAAELKAIKEGGGAGSAGGGAGAARSSGISRWQQPAREPFRVAGAGGQPAAGGDRAWAGNGGPGGPDGAMPAIGEVKTISFTSAGKAGPKGDDAQGFVGVRPDAPPTVIEASPDYLPPNSYAPARVIVGVDASAGVNSQTDPLPVVLRITGPARSVINNGRVLTTRLEGCVVNGAARGDLSAEKVYVKLAKMTCDQPGGRVAVSEVKGFISFAGKTGVRGKVVSREGSLVTRAFIAGIAGGFGRGFTANANALFQGANQIVNGERQQLSPGEIAKSGLGQGVAQSADMVSKYLIERAEQYQPVIEMPTGIDVEIVFLDGVYVRGSE